MINTKYVSYRDALPETYEGALRFMDRIYWRMVHYDIPGKSIIANACTDLIGRNNRGEEYVSTYIPR